jgi:transcriptional regulator with XRE-family HTH domain
MVFAKRMKKIRKTLGYTQKDFAELLKVGYSTYQQYESGMVEPKNEFTQRLCMAYPGFTLWLMIEQTYPPHQIDPWMYEMKVQYLLDQENL